MSEQVIFSRAITPVDDDGLRRNVRSALARGLPELRDFEYPQDETLRIIANGPSARAAPLDGPTVALNGALGLFTDRGIAPNYWGACDPQPLVAGFLGNPPRETKYLVCSKCDPSVFDALRDHDVTVWHLDDYATWDMVHDRDPIALACSITLVSFELMNRLGWRKVETWGWDGCFMGGHGHAMAQPENAERIEMDLDGQTFETTVTWAFEGENAVNLLRHRPFDVTVRGDGFFGALLRTMLR